MPLVQVARIICVRLSTHSKPGEWVLSDERLREIGGIMADVEKRYPVGPGSHPPDEVLMDMEFKITQEKKLIFKDVRQFLISNTTGSPLPGHEVQVREGRSAFGNCTPRQPVPNVYRPRSQPGRESGE